MKHRLLFAVFVASAICGTSFARASENVFPPEVTYKDLKLSLHGHALLRYKVVFKVYNIALYLADGVPADRVFDDVPKRLEVKYLLGLTKANILEAGDVALRASVDPATLESLQDRIDQINSLYQDVGKGDTYAITYIPGEGTELAFNGERKGIIEGADFAAAYFKIWLGDNAPRPDVRDKLLKKAQ